MGGGGGGAQKFNVCPAHITSAKREVPCGSGQGPIKGRGSFKILDDVHPFCALCGSILI